MYSLHDITSVCPKLEPLASDESCCREEESLRLTNHANGQMETLVRVSAENNNGLMMESGQLDVYGKTPCVEMSVYEGITTNNTIAYEVKSMATVVKTLPADAYHGNASGQMSYATVKIPYEIKSIGTIEKPIPFGSKPNGIEKSRPGEAYHSNTCGQRSNGAIKIPYEIKSIGSIEKPLLPEDSYPTSVSEEMPHGKILNVYTVPVYENGGSHEVYYYPMESDTQEGGAISQTSQAGTPVSYVYDSGYDPCERTRSKPEVTPSPAGLAAYQSSTYGTILRDQLGPDRLSPPYDVLNQEKAPGLQMNTFRGTHRALTPYEIGAQPRPSCNCSCHHSDPGSSHFPAFGLRNERPSVIMVPATWNGEVMSDAADKFESTAHGIRQDLQQKEYHELDDSDSSDDGDEDGKHEKYFRKNIDGTTARFKLSKEDWKRIPINTFPSGGRLLSGDWTRIFLSKVKESNPWCSLRFKNNHVRSENSRKIHSAVFFRGGAECKRPECNVKVRFVIRKEKGKHVEVTYVGNVCHNSQPGGGDVITDKRKKRCVRRPKFTSSLDD